MKETKNYDKVFESLFISILVSNPTILTRALGILRAEYFEEKANKAAVEFLLEYCNEYSTVPDPAQIKVKSGVDVQIDKEMAMTHEAWALKELEEFCKYKALKSAIISSPDLLKQGRYGEVEALIKSAVQIALVKDLGLDYYKNPKDRLEQLKNNKGQLSTGWKSVDEKLFGGINRGEITIFAGQSGSGKSLFLQNIAVNCASNSLNVVYLSLELSENLCAMRIDAMHTGLETREVMKHIDEVHVKIKNIQRNNKGSIQIKQMKNGCTSNDIRAYIKEYEIDTGKKVDAIIVDYLDLMAPTSKTISSENLFVKDKYVTEELRNLAVELDVLMVSASQLNRSSYEEIEFDPSHIAGGISKVNTADNVIGIFTSAAMRESGRFQIQFMKTRSSSGVGSKVDLSFDTKSLRITDLEGDADDAITATTKTTLSILKRNSIVKSSEKVDPSTGEITSTTNHSKNINAIDSASSLRDLLKKL